ncbi:MAG: glycoside hydrolase family 9 protein, partial [Deltaproteobacteria bacterium]|nr:glycoside hydrolase family 9 protein [Deltaproteobacteria bacterium]
MLALLLFATTLIGHGAPPEAAALDLPRVGDRALRLLSPTVLELTLVTQGKERWDFTDPARMPTQLAVLAEGKPLAIAARGFRRRTLYAPLKRHDLRVGCSLYLELASPIPSGAEVRVRDPAHELGPEEVWWGTLASSRESPVIHVNQAGYAPGHHKRATIGAFLGTLGELKLPAELAFSLVDEAGKAVFQGKLRPRPDGAFKPPAYQRVLEADFTAFETPGTYRVEVATLGRSMPFTIDDAQPALLARTYALGMLHQRCGFALELPFTRFTHPACHLDPVAPASDADKSVLARLARNEASHHPKQTAPALTRPSASLMPFSSQEPRAIFGGHHDAGDYGRYTENSAALVHTLVFAADNFPGVAALDNLGLPESGDGKGDVLQLAAWEAEYLLRLQDPAGGFA